MTFNLVWFGKWKQNEFIQIYIRIFHKGPISICITIAHWATGGETVYEIAENEKSGRNYNQRVMNVSLNANEKMNKSFDITQTNQTSGSRSAAE